LPIHFFTLEIQFELTHKRSLNRWIKETIFSHSLKCGDISYIFTGNDKILEINQQFLKHNYYTDIITFNYNYEDFIAGDIYISIETVRTNSQIYTVTFEEELYRVMIHGILHLLGFDDKSKKDKILMKDQENSNLEILYSKYLLK
jgi:rRNA maturation RNase YbeY